MTEVYANMHYKIDLTYIIIVGVNLVSINCYKFSLLETILSDLLTHDKNEENNLITQWKFKMKYVKDKMHVCPSP